MDRGNPICYCPKGLTGNPFKNCSKLLMKLKIRTSVSLISLLLLVPEGDECTPNPCGPNSGCRRVNGQPLCFCLPEFEGNPPERACALPQNPCSPSPCGPNSK